MNQKDVIKSQYHASLEMFRQVVEACPENLWADGDYRNQFWNIAAHTLFYTHFYLHRAEDAYEPWTGIDINSRTFDPPEDDEEKVPATKGEVMDYLDFLKTRIDPMVDDLDLATESGFYWLPFNKLELQFYNIRHVMQHTGELGERLWQAAGIETPWVGKRPEDS
jgi:hypothetical protein